MIKVIKILGEVASKKNSKQIVTFGGRPRLISSKQYRKWEKEAKAQLYNVKPWSLGYPVGMGIYLFRKTKRAFDWNNLGQGIQDVLVEQGILAEDNMDHLHPFPIGWEKDKDNPRAIVTLCSLQDSPLMFGDMAKFTKLAHEHVF